MLTNGFRFLIAQKSKFVYPFTALTTDASNTSIGTENNELNSNVQTQSILPILLNSNRYTSSYWDEFLSLLYCFEYFENKVSCETVKYFKY